MPAGTGSISSAVRVVGVGEIRRRARALIRRACRHRRPILGVSFTNQGTRRHQILKIFLNVLVVDIQLIFQRVEFRIVKDRPPLTAWDRLLGIRHLPPLGILEVDGGFFVIDRHWSRRRWTMVSRPQQASGHGKANHDSHQCASHTQRVQVELHSSVPPGP